MIQPALLLLLLAAMSSPVFGTEISVHHYCVSVCSLTTKVCTTGCVRDLLDEVSFLGNNIANQPFTTENASQCRQECTKNDTCQYFTFVDENAGIEVHRNKCFLKASTGDTPEITIQHLQHATSGYSLRNCSGKVTYSAQKYSLVPEKKNWTEAQEYCTKHYTNLAIIRTEEDWKAIQASLAQRQYMCQRVHHGNGTTEKMYELMPGPKTQQDAETDCRTIKGRELASICNQKEQEAFDELTTEETWIGLEHNKNNTLWEWSNGEPFQQRELTWGDGNCQQLNSDRKWTPKDCSNQSAFPCYGDERPLNTTGDLTIPVTPETTSPSSTGPPSIKTSTTTPTTLLPTTTTEQSITSPPTTTNGQSTTSPTTTTNGQSITSPPTTNVQSTTSPPTTTIGQSTTSPPTTMHGQSTTSPPTTTNGQSTTSPPTTTNGQSTTSTTTTTIGQSISSRTTTTNGQSITSPTTTTNGQSITSTTTTTNGHSTTSPTSTSSGQLTSLGPTSSDRKSTSSPSSTTSPLHPVHCSEGFVVDKAFPWNDTLMVYERDLHHCQLACTQNPGCSYFSYVVKEFHCYQKFSDGQPTMTNYPGVISGYTRKGCSKGPPVEIPVFTLVSEGRSMAEAQKFCREYYDELATIFNAEDQTAALRAVSAQSLTDAIWVHSQCHAFWPQLPYWNTPHANCVVHGHTEKVWILRNCTNSCHFVCQKSTQSNNSSELKYYMGQGSLMWDGAQTACRANGDDLASIITQEDYTAFQSITETQQFEMWIGLYWKTSTRMWQWSNGDPFPYCVSEPQLGASNCCSLTHKGHGRTENVTLEKIDCSLKRPFLCTGKKRMKQTIVRMSLKSNSGADLNDPVVKEQMLEQIRKELAKDGNFILGLRWRELPNGDVFLKTVEHGSSDEGQRGSG
eukprot:XP_014063620.1 PREDICTED: uncharacterized protein LOC106609370 [Salmo salar]